MIFNYQYVQKICKKEKIYILVLARSNSSRVREKNTRQFYGEKSLIEIKMNQIINSGIPKSNILTSFDFSLNENNCTQIIRDTTLFTDDSIKFSDLLHNLFTEIKKKRKVSHLLITYPTSPMFDESLYRDAIYKYYSEVICGSYDSIISGVMKRGFFWYHGKTVNYCANENHQYTQNISPVFEVNNALYGGKFEKLLERRYFIGENPYFLENRVIDSIDVDTIEDFLLARSMYVEKMRGGFSNAL